MSEASAPASGSIAPSSVAGDVDPVVAGASVVVDAAGASAAGWASSAKTGETDRSASSAAALAPKICFVAISFK